MLSSLAEVVFVGGSVFTGLAERARRGSVAVSGGRVIAVGADEEIEQLVGPATERVDVAGGMLLPGFVDAHIHPVEGGLERMRCDLSGEATREGYLAAIAEYAAAHPEAPWIVGGGWQVAAFPGGTPDSRDLDAIVPDRPVFLANRDHHGAWVNSRALELAGVTAATPDPVDGRIERRLDGSPSGTLHEGARLLVTRMIPLDTPDEERAALLLAQRYLHSLGIVGWQDAIVGEYGNHHDTGPLYLATAEAGELTARVVAAMWWQRDRGLEQIEELVSRRSALQHPRFRATSVKIMQDGIPENGTAGMLEPYLADDGTSTGERGLSFVDPELLARAVTALDARGFQVHVHAIGDRAVRESLDAIAAARAANGPTGPLHHIAHLQLVDPADIPRFAGLGVAVNMQPRWASWEPQNLELNLPRFGPERADRQYPFGSLWAAGAAFCSGSDWPVTTPDPWAALHVAVNRRLEARDPDYTPRPLAPNEALTLAQALSAATHGSALVNGFESDGTIVPGAVADLAVVDRDPFSRPLDEIADTRTISTWVDGRRVHG